MKDDKENDYAELNGETPMTASKFLQEIRALVGWTEPHNGQKSSAQVIADLSDPHWKTRVVAVRALARLEGKASLTRLLKTLEDADPSVRAATVQVLGTFGEDPPTQHLIHALRDSAWNVRVAAVQGLSKLSKGVPAEVILRMLEDVHPFVRAAAVWATLAVVEEKIVVQYLAEALQDRDAVVRETAAAALGKLKRCAPLEQLLRALNDKDESVRTTVAITFEKFISRDPVKLLMCSLKDPDEMVRSSAVRALGELKEQAPIAPLAAALQDSSAVVREAAAGALSELGEQVPVELLAQARDVHTQAIQTLVRLGERETQDLFLSSLKDFLLNREGEVSKSIRKRELVLHCAYEDKTYALGDTLISLLKPYKSIGSLESALMDEDEVVRSVASEARDALRKYQDAELLLVSATVPNKEYKPMKILIYSICHITRDDQPVKEGSRKGKSISKDCNHMWQQLASSVVPECSVDVCEQPRHLMDLKLWYASTRRDDYSPFTDERDCEYIHFVPRAQENQSNPASW